MDLQASPPDIFESENLALLAGRAALGGQHADCREALGQLLAAYERLLRETRRLVRRSDRTEREMSQLNQRLQDLARELQYRATHDPLTGVLNRAAVIELAGRGLLQHDLSLIVLDIDHFKRINDSFGHPAGDRVIVGVVNCLQAVVPDSAHVGRVGGEEFTVVLPAQDGETAAALAEAMRRAIEGHGFGLPDGSAISASFGVSWTRRGGTFDDAYTLADDALYAAKRGGRNRVCTALDRRQALAT